MSKTKGSYWQLLVYFIGLFCVSSTLYAGLTPKQIYQLKSAGVVLIIATDGAGTKTMVGSGSIISKDGLIITNYHVIQNEDTKQPFKQIHIFLKPEKVTGDSKKDLSNHYFAEVSKFSNSLDLALLKVKSLSNLKEITVIEFGSPDDVCPGDNIVAIGHPEQGGFWTLTVGVISNQIESYGGIKGKDVFQMETDINRGNSGGPLFDQRGYMIGINTMIARKAKDNLAITGINFAIKSSVVKKWLNGNNINVEYGTLQFDDASIAKAYSIELSYQTMKNPEAKLPAYRNDSKAENVSLPKKHSPRIFTMDFQQIERPYKIEELYKEYIKFKNEMEKAKEEFKQEMEKQKMEFQKEKIDLNKKMKVK